MESGAYDVPAGRAVPGWDPIVRLTHWGIATAVLVNGILIEDGPIHIWVGYAAFALLGLRLLWGIVGTRAARFTAFPPSPKAALTYLKGTMQGKHRLYRSHNPAGALMVYAVWGTLAVVAGTGIAMAGTPFEGETLRSAAQGFDLLEGVHEAAANLLFGLAALHIAAVVFESWTGGKGFVAAMTRGTARQSPESG